MPHSGILIVISDIYACIVGVWSRSVRARPQVVLLTTGTSYTLVYVNDSCGRSALALRQIIGT